MVMVFAMWFFLFADGGAVLILGGHGAHAPIGRRAEILRRVPWGPLTPLPSPTPSHITHPPAVAGGQTRPGHACAPGGGVTGGLADTKTEEVAVSPPDAIAAPGTGHEPASNDKTRRPLESHAVFGERACQAASILAPLFDRHQSAHCPP